MLYVGAQWVLLNCWKIIDEKKSLCDINAVQIAQKLYYDISSRYMFVYITWTQREHARTRVEKRIIVMSIAIRIKCSSRTCVCICYTKRTRLIKSPRYQSRASSKPRKLFRKEENILEKPNDRDDDETIIIMIIYRTVI